MKIYKNKNNNNNNIHLIQHQIKFQHHINQLHLFDVTPDQLPTTGINM